MSLIATVDDVQDLLLDSSLSDGYVTSILTTVDRILVKTYEHYTGSISSSLLGEIQKYYAAHIITATYKRFAVAEQIGEARVEWAGKFGIGFQSTPFGQILLALDPSGLIAKTGIKSADFWAIKGA